MGYVGFVLSLERFAHSFQRRLRRRSVEHFHFRRPYVSPVHIVTSIEAIIVGFLAVQGGAVGHVYGSPTPPPRRSRVPTMRQFLHVVFVPSRDPLIDHGITIHGQKARVTFPHLGRGMVDPAFGQPLQGSPNLVRFTTLLSKPPIVQRFRTRHWVIKGDEGNHDLGKKGTQDSRRLQNSFFLYTCATVKPPGT